MVRQQPADRIQAILLLLLLTISAFLVGITLSMTAKASPGSVTVPSGIKHYVPITLTNTQNVHTSSPFQQMIEVNSATYSTYEDPSLQNVEFFDSNGVVIASWLESGNSNSAVNSAYWLSIVNGIPASTSITIYMGFASLTMNMFNTRTTGEAPQLSSPYAQYDDGDSVFSFYDNFAGSQLKSSWLANMGNGSYSVNNGLTLSYNGLGYLATVSAYSPGSVFDTYINSSVTESVEANGFFNPQAPSGNHYRESTVIIEACNATVPDQFNTQGEANPCGNNYGYLYSGAGKHGVYSVELLSSSSSIQYFNYSVGQSHQPITTYAPPYPLPVGFFGGNVNPPEIVQWARVRASPPNGVMPAVSMAGTVTTTTTTITSTSATSIATSASPTTASPWPMFRHDAMNTGLSTFNGPSSPRIRWNLSNVENTEPVIGPDGTIYIPSSRASLYALSPDGTMKGNFSVSGSSAIGMDGTIYVVGANYTLYAMNPGGSLKWKIAIGRLLAGQTGMYVTSPVVASDGKVYIGTGNGNLYAINPDGTIRWQLSDNTYTYLSSPAIGANGILYVPLSYYFGTFPTGREYLRIQAIDPKGTLAPWSYYPYPVTGSSLYLGMTSPAVGHDGTIYLQSQNQNQTLFAFNQTGGTKWKIDNVGIRGNLAIGPDGTIYGTKGYGTDAHLIAVDASGRLKWVSSFVVSIGDPAVASDGTIYVGGLGVSGLYAVNPDGTIKWNLTIGTSYYVSDPILGSNGTIYVTGVNKYYNSTTLYAVMNGSPIVTTTSITASIPEFPSAGPLFVLTASLVAAAFLASGLMRRGCSLASHEEYSPKNKSC